VVLQATVAHFAPATSLYKVVEPDHSSWSDTNRATAAYTQTYAARAIARRQPTSLCHALV